MNATFNITAYWQTQLFLIMPHSDQFRYVETTVTKTKRNPLRNDWTSYHRIPIQRRKTTLNKTVSNPLCIDRLACPIGCQKELDGNERINAIERTKSTYRKKRKGEMPKQKVPDSSFGRTFKAKLLFSKVCSSVAVPKSKVAFYMEHGKLIASYFSLFWQWTNQNGRLNVYHNCAPIRTLGHWLVI